jgi:ASC-1-like (ASCH) protein
MFDNVLLLFVVIFAAVLLYKALCWVATKCGSYSGSSDCHYDDVFIGGKKQRLMMTLQDPWFGEAESGKKTVEPRISNPLYKKDEIIKISKPGGNKLRAKIVSVKEYPDLETFVKDVPVKKHAPHLKTPEEALAAYKKLTNKAGEHVFSSEKTKGKTISAIEFALVK